jgi:hypothetical protein
MTDQSNTIADRPSAKIKDNPLQSQEKTLCDLCDLSEAGGESMSKK